MTGIIGRSGAGKSTLLRMVNGLERPSRGRSSSTAATWARASDTGLRAIRARRMIFQHFNLLASRTVAENIALPLEIAGESPTASPPRQRTDRTRRPVGTGAPLSGGTVGRPETARVGIARALATLARAVVGRGDLGA